jgi:hypothetical protein
MKKLAGISALALIFAVSSAQAQNVPGSGSGRTGSGPSVGEKESVKPNDPSRSGRVSGSQDIPGRVGSGASVGDKNNYNAQDPSRTGRADTERNPGEAGSIGNTGTGK